jgi:AbrB family looped-hinge helix DNA binding protein
MGALALAEPTERMGHRELAEDTEPAKLQTRMRMGEKGRIVIPAAMREALGMAENEVIDLCVEDGELRIVTLRETIRRVQERAKRIIKPGVSLADELSAERREAAKHE